MVEEQKPIEIVGDIMSNVDYLKDLNEFMDDDNFEEVMKLTMKIISDPNIPPPKVATLCVRLEAYAIEFRTKFVAYQSFRKGQDSLHKKNMYRAIYDGLDRLVDSLKYLIR